MLFDKSLKNTNNLVCGGNKAEYHYTGFDIEYDIGNVKYFIFPKLWKAVFALSVDAPLYLSYEV